MITIGVDEAGRGPLAGSVIASAVILPNNFILKDLNDSKKLTDKKRRELYQQIIQQCVCSIGEASSEEIDQINILEATMLAMKRSIITIQKYNKTQDKTKYKILVDGNRCPDVDNCTAIIKGDLSEPAISAASIIAKVTRDNQMLKIDTIYPQYGFAKHKGYGTKIHMQALKKYGIIKGIHRKSFAPVKNIIY